MRNAKRLAAITLLLTISLAIASPWSIATLLAQEGQVVVGNGPLLHGSAPWNQAGYDGRGVKVGVIDGGFEGISALLGTELPASVSARCYTDLGVFTTALADCENGRDHGTAVAESLMDIAPGAMLYISTARSPGDVSVAVDWMVAEGVQVINRSADWVFDGPGDGTSPYSDSPLNTVDRAVDAGVVWVNAASNTAEVTWFGPPDFYDGDTVGFHRFRSSDIRNGFYLEAGDTIVVQLRWDDTWGGSRRDLDVMVWAPTAEPIILAGSFDPQSGNEGDIPFETFSFTAPLAASYSFSVGRRVDTPLPNWIQLMVFSGVGTIEHHTKSGSITNPGESANPGMLAVGASPWYGTNAIALYSSQGPTPDGRIKPEVVGADCGETATRAGTDFLEFCGTSQAAPHVAGMAALVRQRFPDLSPVQVADYLKDHAVQRVEPDPNNTWGHGFAKLPAVDGAVLKALYNATGGANWANNDNWMTSGALSTWHGVTTDSQGRVTELNLTSNRLKGELPPELGNLANLQVLALGGNQLTGKIPAWLGSLANLQELYLWGNQLTGEIPAELGSLPSLTILSLSDNQLTGQIPTELGSLSSLHELNLTRSQLTGPIPTELANLTNLQVLALGGNQLTGKIPAWLGSLANLQELYLWENQLTGEIPAELGNLPSLTILSLSDNQLTGTVPAWLGNLNNLERLRLSQNQLTGPIPSELGSLANLTILTLSANQLTGEIPAELGSLPSLTILSLSDNQLTGQIPTELGSLSSLHELNLTRSQLTGPIPTELANLTNLQVLALGGNQLTGKIPAWLGSLANLQELYLWENQLTGEIPAELGNLPSLTILSLSDNQLTGTVPAWLGNLNNLERLRLSQNQLTGPIPSELGSLANLTILTLSANQLTGEIPVPLGDLTNLEVLVASRNELTGGIPDELERLTNLQRLSLYGNQLTGPIPSWLGLLTNLEFLSLRENQLTGTIPVELGNLTNLTTLGLSANQLTGEIPAELGKLDMLEELHLSENQLTGCIPTTLRDVLTNDLAELGLPFCVTSLIDRYDTNNNGIIERSEVIAAINDYLFGGRDITRSEVIRLINLYLFG